MEDTNSKKIIFFLLISSTAILILQRLLFGSWDFEVYVLNGRFWFSHGYYFEVFRPPFTSFILGILYSIFGKISEVIYIILVSYLFMISSTKLAETLKLNKVIFYGLSLNLFVLCFGTFAGTELLSIALLELSIHHLIKNRPLKFGIFLGLSSLTRYNMVLFLPLIFFQKKIKKIIPSLIGFTITWISWLIYNKIHFGNFIYSFIDQYINNYGFRNLNLNYYTISLDFIIFFNVLILLIPTLIKQKTEIYEFLKKRPLIFWIGTFITISTLISYWHIPYKSPRYLFNLVIPTTTLFAIPLSNNKNGIRITLALFIISWILLTLIPFSPHPYLENDNKVYGQPIKTILPKLRNCSILSNNWIYLDYIGLKAGPLPFKELFNKEISKGKVFLYYKFIKEPYYITPSLINNYTVLYNNSKVIIFKENSSKKCYSDTQYINSYTQSVLEVLKVKGNQTKLCDLLPNKLLTLTCQLASVKIFNY